MADLSTLLSRKRDKKQELKTYQNRKKKLKDIQQDFERDFDDDISEAIKHNEKTGSGLLLGLQGETLSVKNICFEIEEEKEKSRYNDGNMQDISSNLTSEISRCTSEIDRLELEIDRLEQRIRAAREEED